MRVSLIITTFNRKEALELVLLSAFAQANLPDEIIVADDGSETDTAQLICSLQPLSPVPLRHSWQEHRGFRASRSRNLAINQSSGDYIILIDGDMVLSPMFTGDHRQAARKKQFVQGSRVILSASKTRAMLAAKKIAISFFATGIENRKNSIHSPLLSLLFSGESTSLTGIRTCNFAFWKSDAIEVNGFNEDFVGWGREDSEFAARLMNFGVHRKNLRFRANAYHLFHSLQPRVALPKNDAILENTISKRLAWCDNGLIKS